MSRIARIFLILIVFALPVMAQEQTGTATTTAPATTTTPTTTVVESVDSSMTREQLHETLRRLPPQVGRALKLDPTLWTNKEYLAHYPALASFVATHPEVTHSPDYYLENVYIPVSGPPETASIRLWNNIFEGIAIFTMIALFTSLFAWLIKTLVDHRRWSRMQKIQSEVHNKILDRFASNEDLLAYVKTPAGRRFLESAPIPVEGPRAISAPIGRVLWSVQIGIVLAAAGAGLQIVSWSADKDVSGPISGVSVLAVAIGVGFVGAAAVSYILSRKLGIWQQTPALTDTESGAQTIE